MLMPKRSTPWVLAVALILGLAHPVKAAQSESCRLELNAAESRWARMRSLADVAESFEQKVTSLLLKAVELRHEAKIKACLEAVAKAKAEMDQWESGHARGSAGGR